MRTNTLVLLIAAAIVGGSSIAMAHGVGGGGGKGGSGMSHGHFGHHFFRNHFLRNQALLGSWGWGWGWPYSDTGYSNTTVVFPQATPQAANVTGSIATTPCHWNADTFSVPSSAGGTRPVQVVTCR